MKFSRLILSAAAFSGIVASAHATRNPTPPPSGIVVHLFGPQSVMSNIAPDFPGETARPASPQPAGGQAAAGQPAVGQAASAATAPQTSDGGEPTMGAVLHQMFVVGDPNHPTQPSSGRIAERPPGSD